MMDRMSQSYRILDSLRLANGLYVASPSNDYNYVWLRDSCYEVMPYLTTDCDRYEKTFNRLLDVFIEYEWKLDIHSYQKPTKPWEYFHSRFDAKEVKEIKVKWGHVQYDAIGAVLFGIGEGIKHGKYNVLRDEKDREIVQKIISYLECCQYWMDADSGMWEEWREVHSSSVGAVVAGLMSIKQQGIFDVSPPLINKGVQMLQMLFPSESADRPVDLAQLSLIHPYKVYQGEDANKVLQRVEMLLLRERGVIRYMGDSYYSTNNEHGRELPLVDYYGTEAEWTFGLPWLALCHMELGNYDKAREYIERTESVMLEDGSLPELYFAGSEKHNANSPLGWSNAMYILAKNKITEMESSGEETA